MRGLLTFRQPPCLSPLHFSPLLSSSLLFSFRTKKRFHFLKPCFSLKQSKKPSLQKTPTVAPQSFNWLFSSKSDAVEGNTDAILEGDSAVKGTLLAGVLLVGVIGGFAFAGYVTGIRLMRF